MANYHQTGFHTLQELAKTKQAEKLEELKQVYDDKFRIEYPCEKTDKDTVSDCTQRWVESQGDCA